jgi:tRNA threonylcarbamoyladenosine biosynthesis protein TsaB
LDPKSPPGPLPVLGIETSGIATGVALIRGDGIFFESVRLMQASHNEMLLSVIADALNAAGIRPAGLGGLGVTIGPGMFTSLRVGLSTAKGLAVAHATPIKGIGTLQALAASADSTQGPVLALVDARKSQVYAALFDGETVVIPPAVFTPEELVATLRQAGLKPGPLMLAGNGSAICKPLLRAAGIDVRPTNVAGPSPVVVARLAAQSLAAGISDDIETLEPLYLRRTDAELSREARH